MPSLCVYYDLYDYSPTDIPLLLFQFFPNPLFLFSVRFLTDFSAAAIFYDIFVLFFLLFVVSQTNTSILIISFLSTSFRAERDQTFLKAIIRHLLPTRWVGGWVGGFI